mmetsp:Transcript_31099/g.66210  ORF Transcript_31099/g.66210 Transcript_31099/m.66210 type:complete len:110 (-) Transcript_31099:519-848(-)
MNSTYNFIQSTSYTSRQLATYRETKLSGIYSPIRTTQPATPIESPRISVNSSSMASTYLPVRGAYPSSDARRASSSSLAGVHDTSLTSAAPSANRRVERASDHPSRTKK